MSSTVLTYQMRNVNRDGGNIKIRYSSDLWIDYQFFQPMLTIAWIRICRHSYTNDQPPGTKSWTLYNFPKDSDAFLERRRCTF